MTPAVFVVPADRQPDLRAAGKRRPSARRDTSSAASARSDSASALPATIDASVYEWETILVSAGRRGLQIELTPSDLIALTGARVAEVTR